MTTAGFGSLIGRSKWEIDTPALCVDLDIMDRNIQKMAGRILGGGKNWRPHTKGQKIPAIAHKEIAAGAMGVTCAKLSEAEVMAGSGIRDILIANEIVGREKILRLVNVQPHADVMVAIDSQENAREISELAVAKGVTVRVLVELNVGMNRAGVEPGEAVVHLSEYAAGLPGLRYSGVMAWEGHATSIKDLDEKRKVIVRDVGRLVESAERCRAAGLPASIVSCGGTGTYWITCTLAGPTEIQAGGGIFNDVHYSRDYGIDHEFALTVVATVVSRPTPTRIIVDAGHKTMNGTPAAPRPLGLGKDAQVKLSAEHGTVELSEPDDRLKVGDKLEFIVGYSDFTTYVHEEMFAIRDGMVEQVWPVLGRGKLR
ncbi:MAG TPA: DSD1 family PLP-dependent enzyme [Chloroflexota bacterium]|nr:DSD1 family PLP-dependent enzyme [Chloroflexota bacterium]